MKKSVALTTEEVSNIYLINIPYSHYTLKTVY
jgi:hypothetical protein